MIACAACAAVLLASGRSQASTAGPALATATVRTVTSPADAGPGTLRQSLLDAANGDAILFSPAVFPPGSPATIALQSGLPTVTQDRLIIDASNAGVILDGSSVGDKSPGLLVQGAFVTVQGLQIVSFPGCGIELRGPVNTIGGDRGIGAGPLG